MTSRSSHRETSEPGLVTLPSKIIMLTGGIAVALAMVALTPVLPLIEADLAVTATDRLLVKLLVMVIGGTMVLGAPLAGFLIDRVGVRPVLLVCGVTYGLGGTAGLYLDSLPLLICSRLVVGLAAGAIAATSMTLINSRLEGSGRATWMGLHVATAVLGSLALHPLAGLLGEFGWRWPFALYALGFLITGLGFAAGGAEAASPRGLPEQEGKSLLSWFPKRFVFLALVIGCITYLPTVYVPFVLRNAGVSSPLLISLVGFGDAILTAVMAVLFARSQRRLTSQAAFAFSFTCTGVGLAIVATWPSVIGVIVGMAVFGLGLGWFVPNLMTAAASQVGPDQQGRTVGVVKAAHYLAAPASVILIEPVTRQFGPASALAGAAMLSFGLLIIFASRVAEQGAGRKPQCLKA